MPFFVTLTATKTRPTWIAYKFCRFSAAHPSCLIWLLLAFSSHSVLLIELILIYKHSSSVVLPAGCGDTVCSSCFFRCVHCPASDSTLYQNQFCFMLHLFDSTKTIPRANLQTAARYDSRSRNGIYPYLFETRAVECRKRSVTVLHDACNGTRGQNRQQPGNI